MSDNETNKSWKDPTTLATIVIAIATVVNVVVSLIIGYLTNKYTETTQNIYRASNRPYIGAKLKITSNDKIKKYYLITEIRNYGSVPASHVQPEFIILLDGFKVEDISHSIPDTYFNLYPNSQIQATHQINAYADIRNGHKILEIETKIKYKGITEDQYEDYQKWRYSIKYDRFVPIDAYTK